MGEPDPVEAGDKERKLRHNNIKQVELLVEFLERHPVLAFGTHRTKEARAQAYDLWTECATILNAAGPKRSGKKWAKIWSEYKCRVRIKARNYGMNALGPLEKKMLRVSSKPKASGLDTEKETTVHFLEMELEKSEDKIFSSPFKQEQNGHTDYEVLEEYEELNEDALEEPSLDPASPGGDGEDQPKTEDDGEEDEVHATLIRIEATRAEADLKHAQALCSIASSFRLMAESIDRLSRKFCDDSG